MLEQSKLKVFLCHASQDKPIVRDLYQRLSAEGWIDPWLDEENILAGQEWEYEIEKAVESADVVIVLLSSVSVNKEGYIQKEIRYALDIALEKPEGTIFIIPLRLDNCAVPRKIKHWQYLDYFPIERLDWVYKKILDSLRVRANGKGISTIPSNHPNTNIPKPKQLSPVQPAEWQISEPPTELGGRSAHPNFSSQPNSLEVNTNMISFADGTTMEIAKNPFTTDAEGDFYLSADSKFMVCLYYLFPIFAEKWRDEEYRDWADNQKKQVEKLVEYSNMFHPQELGFMWPEKMVVSPRFGWITLNAPNNFRPLADYVSPSIWQTLPKKDKGSWEKRFFAAINLVKSIAWLHQQGLIHTNLAPGDILIRIQDGKILVGDVMSIVFPGNSPRTRGALTYMAPEVVVNKSSPSIATNLHTLAVLLYRIFLLRHPLQGPKVFDRDIEKDEILAFGEKALYIENPLDQSNRPSKLPFTSDILGEEIKSLFMRAFVDGLHNPLARPTALEWEHVLSQAFINVIPCSNPSCAMNAFVKIDDTKIVCPWCGAKNQ